MIDRYAASKSPFTAYLYWTFIYLFVMVWLSGMTAGLAGGACKNDRYEGVRKLRACNISLTAGAWLAIFPGERARGASLHLERGLALLQAGRPMDARLAFERAYRHAQAKQGPWLHRLHNRMNRVVDPHAQALWISVANRP